MSNQNYFFRFLLYYPDLCQDAVLSLMAKLLTENCAADINCTSASFYLSNAIHRTSTQCYVQADDSKETEIKAHSSSCNKDVWNGQEWKGARWTQIDNCCHLQCLTQRGSGRNVETWWERRILADCGRIAACSNSHKNYHFVSWRCAGVTSVLPGAAWTSQKVIEDDDIPTTCQWNLTSLQNYWVIWCESSNSAFSPIYCSFSTGPVPQTHSFASQHVRSPVKETGSAMGQIDMNDLKRRSHQQIRGQGMVYFFLVPVAFQ